MSPRRKSHHEEVQLSHIDLGLMHGSGIHDLE